MMESLEKSKDDLWMEVHTNENPGETSRSFFERQFGEAPEENARNLWGFFQKFFLKFL